MPLKSYVGRLAPLSREQLELREQLSKDVKYLSDSMGERSMERAGSLQKTTDYIRQNLQQAGYSVTDSTCSVRGEAVSNVEAILVGSTPEQETIVVGAHYDSVVGTVGANDNATGVAVTLELARLLKGSKPRKSVRFVFFVNEEPPYFQTEDMGSKAYARNLRHEGVSRVGNDFP